MATNDILLIPTPLQSSIPSCCLGLIALVTMVMMMINTVDWSVVETSFADTSNHPTRRLQHTIKKSTYYKKEVLKILLLRPSQFYNEQNAPRSE